MLNTQLKIFAFLFVCQFFIITHSVANEIRIAVASNFYPTMKAIVEEFELENYESSKINKIVLIPGSSGKHYAQIINGCLLYTSPSPRDRQKSRMPSSA